MSVTPESEQPWHTPSREHPPRSTVRPNIASQSTSVPNSFSRALHALPSETPPGLFSSHDARNSGETKLGIRERVRHFTWTWFTMSMSTGGIASVIYHMPFRFHGLYAIGCIFFLLNLVLFLFNVSMITLRFVLFPNTLRASFMHPTESLFMPSVIVSIGIILETVAQYGFDHAGNWLLDAVFVLYWIYCAMAFSFSFGIYLLMWSTQTFTIARMTPIWIFPAYPLLIVGPFAGVITSSFSATRALDCIVGGVTLQSTGFMVSLMIYSAFIYRLMTQKLPQESLRPGMFVSVGPSSFTASGVVHMATNIARAVPPDFMGNGPLVAFILKVMANWWGVWLWGLALWFFFISVCAHYSCVGPGKLNFQMTWFSFVFPNTALTNATFAVGMAFDSRPIQIVGTIMAVAVICMWFVVMGFMIRAVWLKQILWPQKQEDREEGGWKTEAVSGQTADGFNVSGDRKVRTGGRVWVDSQGRERGGRRDDELV